MTDNAINHCGTAMCEGGCAGPCQQGRRTCRGRPLPMSRATRALIRNPSLQPYVMGVIAVALVLLCVVLGSALATYYR